MTSAMDTSPYGQVLIPTPGPPPSIASIFNVDYADNNELYDNPGNPSIATNSPAVNPFPIEAIHYQPVQPNLVLPSEALQTAGGDVIMAGKKKKKSAFSAPKKKKKVTIVEPDPKAFAFVKKKQNAVVLNGPPKKKKKKEEVLDLGDDEDNVIKPTSIAIPTSDKALKYYNRVKNSKKLSPKVLRWAYRHRVKKGVSKQTRARMHAWGKFNSRGGKVLRNAWAIAKKAGRNRITRKDWIAAGGYVSKD